MLVLLAILALLFLLAAVDLLQRRHTIRRNFPLIGRLRYLLESIGPELRQYIITSSTEERPFARNERRWVYATAKQENDQFGFGTDINVEAPDHLIVKPAVFALPSPSFGDPQGPPNYSLPCAKILGAGHGRAKAFRPASVVNISGMSYGALSGPAVEALNRGAKLAGCLQATGEGGFSQFHDHGAEMIFQFGTGYFGCRNADGSFSFERLVALCAAQPQIRAVEIKLGQGAKMGIGGTLPGAKVTPQIAQARGIPVGVTCHSPNSHTAFGSVAELVQLIERIAAATGLPVGIKSAVGRMEFWEQLTAEMVRSCGGPDYVVIDGGEGGTGAAPLVYADHVGLPFMVGFPRVYACFARAGLHEQTVFVGSGRLGLPGRALTAFALGCDTVNVGREAMLAIGCIQAQRCHTNHCPTGIATHNRWLMRGLDPSLKSARCANYLLGLRRELLSLARSCGEPHPALIGLDHFETLVEQHRALPLASAAQYEDGWGLPGAEDRAALRALLAAPGPGVTEAE